MADGIKRQIRVGTGAPLLRKKRFGKRYNDFLLKNCLHNFAYDAQSEGPRGWYAYQLLRRSKHHELLCRRFRKRFAAVSERDSHHTDQAFAVALELYRDGRMKRGPIIAKFRELNAEPNAFDHGWGTVIHLGRKGLYAFMEVAGRQVKGSAVGGSHTWVMRKDMVQRAIKEQKIELPPRKQEENKHVRRYRRRVLERDYARSAPPNIHSVQDYAQLLERIATGQPVGRPRHVYKALTGEQLRELARYAREEADPFRKAQYLRAFDYHTYPSDPLVFVADLDAKDPRLATAVSRIIGQWATLPVRRLARSRLKQRQDLPNAIILLTAAFQESDDALIYRSIRHVRDQDELHAIGFAVAGILERHPRARLHRTLDFLYAHGRCAVCRLGRSLQLRTAGHLSARREREMRYDSYAVARATAPRKG